MTTRDVRGVTQKIKVSEVLQLLKEGYTRFSKDDKGYGSIQEKYNLSALAVKKLFRTPSLKFKKTIIPDFILDEGEDPIPLSEILGRDVITTVEEEIKPVEVEESALFS